jgi:hypothetical protein
MAKMIRPLMLFDQIDRSGSVFDEEVQGTKVRQPKVSYLTHRRAYQRRVRIWLDNRCKPHWVDGAYNATTEP